MAIIHFKQKWWRKLGIIFSLGCAICLFVTSAQATESLDKLSFAQIQNPDFESMGGIFAMAQDEQGFIWLGGKNGLRRFDGYQVLSFRHDSKNPSSIGSNDISDILLDSQGRLWVATLSGGGLNRFDFNTQSFIRYLPSKYDSFAIGSRDIYALAEDKEGNLWLATHDNGLNRLDTQRGQFQAMFQHIPGLEQGGIRDLVFDEAGYLWVASNNHGLYKINIHENEYYHYQADANDPASLSSNELFKLYIDRFNNLWIGTQKSGLDRLDADTGDFLHYHHRDEQGQSLASGMIWDMAEDAMGALWVATGSGQLCRFDKWQNSFSCIKPGTNQNSISGPVISMLADEAGDLWLGTYDSMLNHFSFRRPPFKVLAHNSSNEQSLLANSTNALLENSNGSIWVASAAGLSLVDLRHDKIKRYPISHQSNDYFPSSPILSLTKDSQGRLLLGTFGEGIYRQTSEVGEALSFRRWSLGLDDQRIWSLLQDRDGSLWVGTQEGGLYRYREGQILERYWSNAASAELRLSNNFIWSLLQDRLGNVWAGTQKGLNKLDRQSKNVTIYTQGSGSMALSDNSVRALVEDQAGEIWVGTSSGLNRLNPYKNFMVRYQQQDGLPDDNITGLLVDDNQNIWMTTQKGLSVFNKLGQHFKNYDSDYGIAGNAHPRRAATLKQKNGDLIFASTRGLSLLNPQLIRANRYIPPLVLTNFFINNRPAGVGHGAALEEPITQAKSVRLLSQQNIFTVEFAALNYVVPEKNKYAFKLQGFEKNWTYTDAYHRRATYTNLDPGHYTFVVKGANNEGVWSNQVLQLNVEVLPTWWQTSWAYLLYIIVGVCSLGFIFRVLNRKLVHERKAKLQLQQLDQLKDRFMTNVSYELRAPLNSILGLVDNMLNGSCGTLPEEAGQHLNLIAASGRRLSNLVNDIVDFEQLKQKDVQLQKRAVDIEALMDSLIEQQQPIAEAKGLQIIKSIEGSIPPAWADYPRVQQVLFNLLDNAIKYTHHGYVELGLMLQSQFIVVSVHDTGRGIDQGLHESIFEGFEQGGSEGAIESGGTGLGLALAKHIVELHGGQIELKSKLGEGSTFSVSLPIWRGDEV